MFKGFVRMMDEGKGLRRAINAAWCLFLAVMAAAESVEVTTVVPQESSRHVRIAVVLNGKPAKDVKVDFCRTPGDQTCFSVFTAADGVATSRVLPLGNYHVVAVLDDGVGSDLYLHVSRKSKATVFSMDLTESFRAAQAALAAAEKLPIRKRVEEFRGSLQDPSGAFIAGVNIKVIRKGSEDKADVVRIESDVNGHFSAQLAEGFYIAFFSLQGFRTEIVPFEVSSQGEKEMLVKLQIGLVTESSQVSTQR
jgi:hypothetical protein